MRKQGIDGTGMLNLYDRVTGIFNEIFDSRLLTASLFALIGYCVLFTQRKFPMRWMIFVLFGMILLAFVTLTARTSGKARVRFHRGMVKPAAPAHFGNKFGIPAVYILFPVCAFFSVRSRTVSV